MLTITRATTATIAMPHANQSMGTHDVMVNFATTPFGRLLVSTTTYAWKPLQNEKVLPFVVDVFWLCHGLPIGTSDRRPAPTKHATTTNASWRFLFIIIRCSRLF